jgi:GTP-binding protein EngB required for normal cell division/uncharacterized protein (DUF697 family)
MNNQIVSTDNPDNARVRREMEEVQRELQEALRQITVELGSKLKPKERAEIEAEFAELNELLERLKTGLVWVALFGKTSVGKSAIANSLLGCDMAKVGVQMDLTSTVTHYRRDPWMLADMPGLMGREDFERIALDEARRSHGIIFVVDGEPYKDEMDMFEAVHVSLPNIPKLVFVNKWDVMQHRPSAEREQVRQLVHRKMRKFVTSEMDIIYGNAQSFDPGTDSYQRQELPNLLDRMYEGAGTLGLVMNVLDPARRAEDLGSKVRDKIMEFRIRLARKIISGFGAAEVAGSYVPFSTLLTTPGLLGSMVYTLMRILGVKNDLNAAKKIAVELLKVCALEMTAEFAATSAIEVAAWVGAFILGPLMFLGAIGAAGAVGYYKYRRTVIFGEVAIEYLRNDCSWGGEDRHAVIMRCRERAQEHYMKFRWKHEV